MGTLKRSSAPERPRLVPTNVQERGRRDSLEGVIHAMGVSDDDHSLVVTYFREGRKTRRTVNCGLNENKIQGRERKITHPTRIP